MTARSAIGIGYKSWFGLNKKNLPEGRFFLFKRLWLQEAAGRIAAAGSADAQGPGKPGKKASPKKKLEDLNDREDLSDRKFSDRNWL